MSKWILNLLLILGTPLMLFGQIPSNCNNSSTPKVLLAGDSWAQFMGDDGVYDVVFDAYGFSDYYLVTETLGSSPPPPYAGSAYAISGSEAREWANTTTYPYIDNMVAALQDNPEIETVVLSIGGNDILAAKSGGGWYKDMDLDVAGSEEALFSTIETNMLTIVQAALDVRPDINVIISSYEYPNFDVEFGTCWIYACPKREDLSRDPNNDLITNAELNQMMITVEEQRQITVGGIGRLHYDNSIGLMHHVYGDGVSGPGVLPAPEGTAPYTPGGNPALPTKRENFRIWGDPIHLDEDAYAYKVRNQVDNLFFSKFRGTPDATIYSEGGSNDGWVDVLGGGTGTSGIRMGDDGSIFGGASNDWRGILSFNTASLPNNAEITGAVIYLTRSSAGGGTNPYALGDRSPRLDIKSGSFGNPGVELSDGTAAASATNVGCFHGSVNDNYDVTRIDIHPSFLQHINTSGLTQFRMYFDLADWSDNYVNYYDGSENGVDGSGAFKSGKNRDGIVYQEKTILVQDEAGNSIEQTIEIPAVAALGLPDVVGTTAPFLDLTYELLLPVELLSFYAEKNGLQAMLDWVSSKEENFAGYEVERSFDGRNWTKIGFVQPIVSLEVTKEYQFTDPFPQPGDNYYRLKMVDLDGSTAYSDIRQLSFEEVSSDWTVYPNPFLQDFWLKTGDLTLENTTVNLLDVLGRSLQSWQLESSASTVINLSVSDQIPAGTYYLQIALETEIKMLKLVKQ